MRYSHKDVESGADEIVHELQFLMAHCDANNIRIKPVIGEELIRKTTMSQGEFFVVLSIKFEEQTFKKTLGPVTGAIHSDHYRDIFDSAKKIIAFPADNHRCC